MEPIQLSQAELVEVWADADETIRSRDGYPLHSGEGAAASAVVLFELEPGKRLGSHRHTAEEVVLVLDGDAEVTVGGETSRLAAREMAVAPALTMHDVLNAGDATLRCVGFFAAAAVQTVYETPLQPSGERVQGTPPPE